MLAEKAY